MPVIPSAHETGVWRGEPGRAVHKRALVAQALLAGVLHTAAFAPSHWWWLQILSLAWLAHLSWDLAPRHAALAGWSFGMGWLCSGLWWLYISLHDFGHLPPPLAVLAVALLAAFLSLYYAAALGLAARWRLHGPWQVAVWAACWLAAELARASWLSGFPWIASGYAHTEGLLVHWAPWIGVYGITLLAALAAASLAALGRHQALPAGIVMGLMLLGQWLPQQFTHSTGPLQASLVQPNVPQDQKFDPERIGRNLQRLAELIESAQGEVVVTPESVIPLPLDSLPQDYLGRLQAGAEVRPLLLGTFLGNPQDGFVNSMAALQPPGRPPYAYGKRHLLPFGETIPPGFHWFVRALGIPMDDQARGQHQQPMAVGAQRLRPLICYEDLFGEDFVDSVVGPQAATVLVNASNLAWFGTVMVQDQHLQFSQMRALEFQRPVIRATNTGATAALDHRGQLLARLPAATAGVLEVMVEGRSGSTPYARWLQALGLTPLWLLALLPLLAAALQSRGRGRR